MSIRRKNTSPVTPPASSDLAFDLIKSVKGSAATPSENPPIKDIEQLTPVEQAVVALDVDVNSLKPIDWLNKAHYDNLKKSNALAPELQRRIEAYKHYSANPSAKA